MNQPVLICNNKDCRKPLSDLSYITPCCHAFCYECIEKVATTEDHRCLSCFTLIAGDLQQQIVRVQNPPSNEWKQRILVGLSPSDCIEAFKAAITFHSYQQSQNLIFSQSKLKEQESDQDALRQEVALRSYEQDLKIGSLEKKIEDLKQEVEEVTASLRNESQQHQDTKRALNHLQSLYDASKQRESMMNSQNMHPNPHIDQIMRSNSSRNVDPFHEVSFTKPTNSSRSSLHPGSSLRPSPPLPNKPFSFRR